MLAPQSRYYILVLIAFALVVVVFLYGTFVPVQYIRSPALVKPFLTSGSASTHPPAEAPRPGADVEDWAGSTADTNGRLRPGHATTTSGSSPTTSPIGPPQSELQQQLQCPELGNAEDVLVILKTGGTVAQARLPVHFETVLRCIPNYIVFSDVKDNIDGHDIGDALDDIDEDIRESHSDFELYRDLQQYNREGRNLTDLQEHGESKEDTRAWRLDKWKFLPLVGKALEAQPAARWYVFIEADTYLVWSNLLQYLENFDSSEPFYIGGQTWIGDTIFGHGGSGIIMSNIAARQLSDTFNSDKQKYYDVIERECCGDLIIAKVFEDIDIHLTQAFPLIQGETPQSLDYSDLHWCRPVVSYHHMSAEQIRQYWLFEQQWLQHSSNPAPILHRDAFNQLILPHISDPRPDWDNDSRDRIIPSSDPDDYPWSEIELAAPASAENCRQACDEDKQCLQYSFTPGECQFGNVVRFGQNSTRGEPDFESGWSVEKIERFARGLEPCRIRWLDR